MEIGGLYPTNVTYGIFLVRTDRLIYLFLVDDCGPGTAARWVAVHIQNDTAVFYQKEIQKIVTNFLDDPIPFGNQLVHKA